MEGDGLVPPAIMAAQSGTTTGRPPEIKHDQAAAHKLGGHFTRTRGRRKMPTGDNNNININNDINNNNLPNEQNANYYSGPLPWNDARRNLHEYVDEENFDDDRGTEDNSVTGRKYGQANVVSSNSLSFRQDSLTGSARHEDMRPTYLHDTRLSIGDKASSAKTSPGSYMSSSNRITLLADEEAITNNVDRNESKLDTGTGISSSNSDEQQEQQRRRGSISTRTTSASTPRETILPQITIPNDSKLTPTRSVAGAGISSMSGDADLTQQLPLSDRRNQIETSTANNQAQMFNSTNSILFLVIGYILWQCIFKNRKFTRTLSASKHHWPAAARRFFSNGRRRSSSSPGVVDGDGANKFDGRKTLVTGDEIELETSLTPTAATNRTARAELNDSGELDAIRVIDPKQATLGGHDEPGRNQEKVGGNIVRLKRVLAKNSFVIAAKSGASRPKVKLLISERLAKLGLGTNLDHANEQQTTYGHRFSSYVLRLKQALRTSWLSGLVFGQQQGQDLEKAPGEFERREDSQQQQDKLAESQRDDDGATESSALLAKMSNRPTTIEVNVHTNLGGDEVASGSSLGASFFEKISVPASQSRSSQLSIGDKSSDATTAHTGRTIQPAQTKSIGGSSSGNFDRTITRDHQHQVGQIGCPPPVAQLNCPTAEVQQHLQQAVVSPSLSEAGHCSSSTSRLSHSLQSSLSTSNNMIDNKQHDTHQELQVNYSTNCSDDLSVVCAPLDLLAEDVHDSLARSKSQSSTGATCNQHPHKHQHQPLQQQRHSLNCYQPGVQQHAKSTSPSNFRPCCSASPSALAHHLYDQRHNCHHHQHQPGAIVAATAASNNELLRPLTFSHNPLVKCNTTTNAGDRAHSTTASCGPGAAHHCATGNDRVKHQYENYYDDEHEDTYRRLTASIGMQFGLAFEHDHDEAGASATGHYHQHQPARLPLSNLAAFGTTSNHHHHQQQQAGLVPCRYCSSPATVRQQAGGIGNLLGGPVCDQLQTSSGNTSLGGSGSGSFSLAMASKPDILATGYTCSNPNCSMCRSASPPPLLMPQLKQHQVGAPTSGGAHQCHPNMSILVQQPSVSTTPPPVQQPLLAEPLTVADFEAVPSAGDEIQQQQQQQSQHRQSLADGQSPQMSSGSSLVSRWNQRRRSTMSSCSRPPRRMSIAGVANWQAPHQTGAYSGSNYGTSQQHNFLHRASIASDGSSVASNFSDLHQHPHQQANYPLLARNQIVSTAHSQSQFCASQRVSSSQYSSSAGSSSGIGFSGSQCTNTPTTSVFPYGSFALNSSKQQQSDLMMMFPSTDQLRATLIGPQLQQQQQPQQQQQQPCCLPGYDQFDPTIGGANILGVYHHQIEPASVQVDYQQVSQQKALVDKQLGQQQQQLAPIMCQGSLKGPPGGVSSPYANRKYSLPVQLESSAAERIMQSSSTVASTLAGPVPNLLFGRNLQVDDNTVAATPNQLQLNECFAQVPSTQQQQQLASPIVESGRGINGGNQQIRGGASSDVQRRCSQTIARQSSFWLEDSGSAEATANTVPTSEIAGPGQLESDAGQNRVSELSRAPLEQSPESPTRADSPTSSRPVSSASSGSPPASATKPGAKTRHQQYHSRRQPSSSPSSSSLPSPDIAARCKEARPLGLGPNAGSISKRRLLGKLRSRRTTTSSRRATSATNNNSTRDRSGYDQRRKAATKRNRQGRDCTSSKSQSLDVNSTDDEQRRPADEPKALSLDEQSMNKVTNATSRSSEQDDEFGSSLDRDFLAAPAGVERLVSGLSSASLERQCRDLWKLRSTLHNDASFGDNWSNYHQRLNRRYDSGYKSIENQFSSSIEGNTSSSHNQVAPAPTQVSASEEITSSLTPTTTDITTTTTITSTLIDGEDETTRVSETRRTISEHDPLLSRPQSGCSGFICELVAGSSPTLGQRTPAALLNDDETLALLDNCDDQHHQDEPCHYDCESNSGR